MARRRKKREKRRPPHPDDCHVFMGEVHDPVAAVESLEIDAAADRKWLAAHPDAEQRERLASPRELRATGSPFGTVVIVTRGPLGSQLRMFCPPEKRRYSVGRDVSRN